MAPETPPPIGKAFIAFLVNIGCVIVAATWAIGSIKSTTAEMRVEISGLGRAVDRLTDVLDKVEADGNSRQARLGVLEVRVDALATDVAQLKASQMYIRNGGEK